MNLGLWLYFDSFHDSFNYYTCTIIICTGTVWMNTSINGGFIHSFISNSACIIN